METAQTLFDLPPVISVGVAKPAEWAPATNEAPIYVDGKPLGAVAAQNITTGQWRWNTTGRDRGAGFWDTAAEAAEAAHAALTTSKVVEGDWAFVPTGRLEGVDWVSIDGGGVCIDWVAGRGKGSTVHSASCGVCRKARRFATRSAGIAGAEHHRTWHAIGEAGHPWCA